ncbi:MAG: hypothetical protein ABFC89_03445 [Methanospirillum sp.]
MIKRLLVLALVLLGCVGCASAALPTYTFPTSDFTVPTSGETLPATAATTVPVVTSAGNQLQVVSTSLDPPVLMSGDTGTLTIVVGNTGIAPVQASRASLSANGPVTVVGDPYPTVGEIGAGNRMTFTFQVSAGAPDGTAYPEFSLAVPDGRGLRYPVPVRVDSTPPAVSFVQKPDAISVGRGDQITLAIGNPRQNPLSGVMVTPQGSGFTATPSAVFIGALAPNAQSMASFNLTPAENASIGFEIVYYNGPNRHAVTRAFPVGYGQSKLSADLILSNFVVELTGGIYKLTGDVNNAGLSDARSVVIAPGEGVTPADPYPRYVIGSLAPDDFASFELEFRAENRSTVPLVISYKDTDGDPFEQRTEAALTLNTTASSSGTSGGLPLVWIVFAIVIAAGVGYLIYRSWKR